MPDSTPISDRIRRSTSLQPSSLPAQLDRLREENERLTEIVEQKDRQLFRYRQRLAKMMEERDSLRA